MHRGFHMIAGVGLCWTAFQGYPSNGFESGPSDDADDPVPIDPDEYLLWRGLDAIERWWVATRQTNETASPRFLSSNPTGEWRGEVLGTGGQTRRDVEPVNVRDASPRPYLQRESAIPSTTAALGEDPW